MSRAGDSFGVDRGWGADWRTPSTELRWAIAWVRYARRSLLNGDRDQALHRLLMAARCRSDASIIRAGGIA